MIISPLLNPKLSYRPSDFTPVVVVGTTEFVLAVHQALGANSVSEFIALAKSKPGTINYGSVGSGGIHHLAMEQFQLETGIKLVHIPYKGGAQSIPALLTNEVSAVFTGIAAPALLAGVKSGTIKFLGIAGPKRYSFIPDVPTLGEVGVPNMDFTGDSAIYAPAGTPNAVVSFLAREIATAIRQPEVLKGLNAAGVTPSGMAPEAFAARYREQIEKYRNVIRASGVQAQ